MIRSTACAALAAASLGLAAPASAHHGFGSFDRAREIEITGTITRIDFVNPHSWVYLEVIEDGGETVSWRCELRAATVLRRSGWSPDMFVPGEQITINGAPDREDPYSCYLSTAIFADGTRADRYGQLHAAEPEPATSEQRPLRLASGEPNLSGDWAVEQLVMSDPRGRAGDLVPLSIAEQIEADEIIPDDQWAGARTDVSAGEDDQPNFRLYRTRPVQLTEAGQRAADSYAMFTMDDPRMRCETTSVLFDWVYDGAVNRITQEDDRIILQYGQFGFTRIIHMDESEHPEEIAPSRAGYSIGRWEDDVLVVDTIGFEPGVLSPPVRHGEQLRIIERFWLDADDMLLRREYVATDPVNWVGEYRGNDWLEPADVPYAPDPCEPELTFINYAEQQARAREAVEAAGLPDQAPSEPAANEAAEDEEEPARPWWRFWTTD